MCACYIVEYAAQMSCQHINKNSSFKGANKIIGAKHGTMTKVRQTIFDSLKKWWEYLLEWCGSLQLVIEGDG